MGFDWSEPRAVMGKLEEELQELTTELVATEQAGAGAPIPQETGLQEELGDVLFCCVNLARHLRVDAESALRAANRKFESRFRYMEKQLEEAGSSLEQASLEQLEALWQQAKQVGD